ncbi:hypothetical protein [Legionella sp. W05-934-2]|uniref:hypothetical protein n=1 Tax=Legionella sp. W05-934-2 TaxID=1198649 RepID=UPI003462041E
MAFEEELAQTKQQQSALQKSWLALRNNDTNLFAALGAGLAFALFKRPVFTFFSGFFGGYSYLKREGLVADVNSQQTTFYSSYRKMMQQGGVDKLNNPDVLELTDTVARNTSLKNVQTWADTDIEAQNSGWFFWRRAAVSPDTQSKLAQLYAKTPDTTDLQLKDVNLTKMRGDVLQRSQSFFENLPKTIEEWKSYIPTNK